MLAYDIIKQFDEIAADIYRDKVEFKRSYTEIAKLRDIKSSYVKQKFASAKSILLYKEQQWACELSTGSRNALLQAGFTSKGQVFEMVSKGIVDLLELPNIGDKKRSEIRAWLFNQV